MRKLFIIGTLLVAISGLTACQAQDTAVSATTTTAVAQTTAEAAAQTTAETTTQTTAEPAAQITAETTTQTTAETTAQTTAETTAQTTAETTTQTTAETTAQTKENSGEEYTVFADLSGTYEDVRGLFGMADGWTNGSCFNCTWRKRNCIFLDGSMLLKIDLDGTGEGKIPYSAAEFRSLSHYGYGRYEVVMKPIKNDGVVSSFFTYTGPSDGNPWDEIDIEFLGKDTTSVQFNYYTNGQGNHEYIYKLGFDAAEEFHAYAFEWREDSIVWFVDGEAVYTVTENIPSTKGKIMMNVWPGTGVDGWLKPFDGTVPIYAEYKSVGFTEF